MSRLSIWLVAGTLSACAVEVKEPVVADTQVEETSIPGLCETWEEFECVGVGSACDAKCLPRFKIVCDVIDCVVQGDGLGGGRSCRVDVPSDDGCSYCAAAFDACIPH